MTVDELRASDTAPEGLTNALTALWFDAHEDWYEAHRLVQDDGGAEAAWVHAYLHRREGDAGNARYWYHLASREFFSGSLEEEWSRIAAALLSKADT
jgi:hypothetical protein